MVQDVLECSRRVVVEVRSSSVDSAQLRDVHYAEVCRLTGKKQSSRIRCGDELEGAIRKSDTVSTRVARQLLRTGRIAIRGRARTSGRNVVIAHDRTHEARLGSRATRMQRTAMTLRASSVEDYLALLFEFVQFWIRIGKRC